MVVAFAWSGEGYGRHAQFVLPAAVYPEWVDDIPPAVDSPAAMFRLSAALLPPPADVVNPAEFIAGLAQISATNALRERADAIHKAGRGTVFTYADAKSTAVKDVKADDFWKALHEGACWMDALPEHTEIPKLALGPPVAEPVADSFPLAVVMAEAPAGAGFADPLQAVPGIQPAAAPRTAWCFIPRWRANAALRTEAGPSWRPVAAGSTCGSRWTRALRRAWCSWRPGRARWICAAPRRGQRWCAYDCDQTNTSGLHATE